MGTGLPGGFATTAEADRSSLAAPARPLQKEREG